MKSTIINDKPNIPTIFNAFSEANIVAITCIYVHLFIFQTLKIFVISDKWKHTKINTLVLFFILSYQLIHKYITNKTDYINSQMSFSLCTGNFKSLMSYFHLPVLNQCLITFSDISCAIYHTVISNLNSPF